jgi:hypothetical protein
MTEIKPGHVLIEVNQGRDGAVNLTIGDNDTSFRVAGPKGFGGSSVAHSFQVKASDLRRLADEYEAKEHDHEQ